MRRDHKLFIQNQLNEYVSGGFWTFNPRREGTHQYANDWVMVRVIGVVGKLLDDLEKILHEIVIHQHYTLPSAVTPSESATYIPTYFPGSPFFHSAVKRSSCLFPPSPIVATHRDLQSSPSGFSTSHTTAPSEADGGQPHRCGHPISDSVSVPTVEGTSPPCSSCGT